MADYQLLDAAYRELLANPQPPPGGMLLAQTVATAAPRRRVLPIVPLHAGWRVLDLGTGFGPLAFELAATAPVEVVGVDTDREVLAASRALAARLGGMLAAGSAVRFEGGDATALEVAPESFDLVTARLLFQHLADPAAAAREVARVLRPGGYVFVFDVDDGLGVSYPEVDGPLQVLERAFVAWQASYGGDREIGRKLSTLLAGAGLSVEAVAVLPEGEHRRERPGDPARTLAVARLRAARDGMAAAGILDADECDRLVAAYEQSPPLERCRIESQVAVIARRPLAVEGD